jgi:hypothetical protein
VHPPWSYQAPSSSAKTAIYPNLTINSIILKREEGGRISVFFEKKRKGEELTNWKGEGGHGRGGDRSCSNVQTEP